MIVFYHTPKTAGISTIRAAAEAIPGGHRRVQLTEMRAWLTALEHGTCDTDGVAFLSGHFGYGIHQRLKANPRTLTFLRHPVERTISMHYEAAQRPDLYAQGDLRTVLSGSAGEPYFGNAQVRHLACADGRPIRGPVSHRHVERAKEVVANAITSFGLTEYFAASITLINAQLGTQLAPRRERISPRLSAGDLDADLLLMIWEHNTLDLELYEYCRVLFFERLRHMNAERAVETAVMV